MGNDGGSIPKRHELVKNAARAPTVSELKATILESLGHLWSHCAISDDPLDKDSVASDFRGKLYNYESVLNSLMNPDSDGDKTPEVRSLRDIAKLKFHKSGDKWTCPISMKELGPATKSVYLIPCGHVFAEVAITEIQDKACPECSEPYEQSDIIAILPTTESEIQRLQTRMEDLRGKGLTHTLKKDKSEKKKKRKVDETEEPKTKKSKTDTSHTKDINNEFAASLTAKVMAEQEERNKQRKLAAAKA